jgi:broad specificity phosphatase PhoE
MRRSLCPASISFSEAQRFVRYRSNPMEEALMTIIRLTLLCVLLGFLPVAASGQPAPSPAEWIDALRLGGYVIVFRHGATNSDQSNTDSMSTPNVPVQRLLSEQGRTQAKSIGESMRRLKLPVGLVMTSPTQRAVDTGRLLGFGDVTATPDLTESGPALSPDENNRRALALRKLVAALPPADNNLVIVSHKPNIIDAFGKDWLDVREGEASVFEPDGNGSYKLIGRIQASEWSKVVHASD